MLEEEEFVRTPEAPGLGSLLTTIRRRRKRIVVTALLVFFVGSLLTIFWPNSYTSTATILIEEPEVPQELVQTTVTTYAAQQVQIITQRVMTRSNLAGIIEKFDLYSNKRKHLPTLLLVDEVQENMKLDVVNVETSDPRTGRPSIDTIAFSVGFEHDDPVTARKVANELVSLYLEENVRTRTVQTVQTSEFLSSEVQRADREVKEIESRYATFKEKNEKFLPELTTLNLQMMQRIDSELLEVQRQLNSVEESRVVLEAQLATIDPTSPTVLADGEVVVSPQDQLKGLQTRLAMLESRYSANHPDVLRTRRDINALRARLGIEVDLSSTRVALQDARTDLAIARERYSDEHPEVKRLQKLVSTLEEGIDANRALPMRGMTGIDPDNPAYLEISSRLAQLEAERKALLIQQAELKSRLADYENRIQMSPQVEREIRAMARELETATQRYDSLRAKQFGAEMGQALESQSKGERFTMVEPPNLPLEPSSPNRAALFLMLLLLSPAIGFLSAQIKESLDQSIWGAASIESVIGQPPIAEIPFIATPEDLQRQRRARFAAMIGAPATAILLLVLVHFLVKPIDVLWYAAMRQLGI